MRLLYSLLALLLAPALSAQEPYTYTSVPGDPLEARIYTLKNGLQVWLSRNTDAPRIQTNIAVRAGSKNDPSDATGLAHYLEHMLFKGTSRIGTVNWKEEQRLLEAISAAYEARRATTDDVERDRIYARIDSLSVAAAQYAVPNEYDKMVKSIGARGTNAYTSNERTVYINDIPSDELEKWMMIESERFQELVLRLFHTELETVYEEFNRVQDNDRRRSGTRLNELLYPTHPYGTQTTIGRGEHLKDPSMVKIHEFFTKYYVPNNMAVILAGDIDFDRTIAMVDKYFGDREGKEVPAFDFTPEAPIVGPRIASVTGPDAEWVDIAWRFDGYTGDQEAMLQLIDGLMTNGRAGIVDLDLLQDQRVLDARTSVSVAMDYSEFNMHGEPKEGQTLEQVHDLLMGSMERLRKGDFEAWLLAAVVNDRRQRQIRFWNEHNRLRAAAMTDAFILQKDWQEVVTLHDRMGRITKQEVVDFANAHLGPGHVVVFKRTGDPKDVYKVPKPRITQLDMGRERTSAWRTAWEKVPSARSEPEFVDYDAVITHRELNGGVPLAVVANPSNDLFSLRYIVDMGTDNDRVLAVAVAYLPYLGTARLGPAAFKEELFRSGLSIDVNVDHDRCYVTLSGAEKDLVHGVDLLEYLLSGAQPDEEALKGLVADIRKERQDRMRNKGIILYQGLGNHARYGAVSPFNDVLSNTDLEALKAADLTAMIHGLTAFKHKVFYYGRKDADAVAGILNAAHLVPAALKEYPPARQYPELETNGNKVYFADHDLVQTEILMFSKAAPFDVEKLPYAALFNAYFGSGLSSIVFQEIREAKALAYGAGVTYTTPDTKDEAHYVRGFIGTQADKLNDAITALSELMNEMPMAREQFEDARASALKVIASTRITKENIYWSWDAMQRLGLDHDVRRTTYERIPRIGLEELKEFFDAEIKGRPFHYCIIGKAGAVDPDVLGKLGPVERLSKEQMFGYPEEHE